MGPGKRMVYAVCLFRGVIQFHRHGARRHLGGSILGPLLGLGIEENGALLIVIWNALILHARGAGMVKDRGLVNLAIFGNVITAWSGSGRTCSASACTATASWTQRSSG